MMDGNSLIHYPWAEPPAGSEAIEVAPGVLWMRLPLPMKLDHVNIFALDDGDGWTIVDTGFEMPQHREIWGALLAGPLRGKPVNRVIVTHHHPDHIGLAGWFQAAHGAELWTTRTAWLMTRMLILDEQDAPDEETLAFWRAAGMDREIYEKRLAERPFNYVDLVSPLPRGYRRIKQGDVIRIGGRDWDVRMGDGHAPEHATFWSRDDSLVLGGDQLLPSISPNLGVYASEPDADPVGDWLESCERLLAHARDDQLVLPGHKLPFTGLPARLSQLIDNHHGALDRLVAHLQTPHTVGGSFAPLYKRKIGPDEYGLALVEAVAHFNHLYQAGRISRRMGDDGAWLWQATDD
ncbi:MAG: MBL fold hydrolase [Confluentimicrobium sp.]|uniref:MBL fold metallo-hydrolase n=1 Tax=Actibacterium sp. TaxID=1872125 RepID=UPI000C688345|nr:MBL fold metallo-hydrolase [Actibacterium sp.]MBC58320.1 MBL fold hydrolase [Actibacterium sp.]